SVAGGTAQGAGVVPRLKGNRRAAARRRRHRGCDGGRRRDNQGRRICSRLFRGTARRDAGKGRFTQGRTDAVIGGGEARQYQAYRQHRGLNQSSPRSRSSRRNGSGNAASPAPEEPRSGGTSLWAK